MRTAWPSPPVCVCVRARAVFLSRNVPSLFLGGRFPVQPICCDVARRLLCPVGFGPTRYALSPGLDQPVHLAGLGGVGLVALPVGPRVVLHLWGAGDRVLIFFGGGRELYTYCTRERATAY